VKTLANVISGGECVTVIKLVPPVDSGKENADWPPGVILTVESAREMRSESVQDTASAANTEVLATRVKTGPVMERGDDVRDVPELLLEHDVMLGMAVVEIRFTVSVVPRNAKVCTEGVTLTEKKPNVRVIVIASACFAGAIGDAAQRPQCSGGCQGC